MPDRKQTPDVLGEILGEVAGIESPAAEPPAVRRAAATRGPAKTTSVPGTGSMPGARTSRPACWEHCVVSFQNYRGWRPRYVDGAEVADWMRGPVLHDYLAQLGSDGWEVAAAASGQPLYGSSDGYQVIFKRMKDEG